MMGNLAATGCIMQKKSCLYPILWLLLVLTVPATAISGREAVLRLSVRGVIKPPPEWRDAMNQLISTLEFEFSGVSDSNRPDRDRDSRISQAKLLNAWTNPVTVKLERPSNCRIGSGHIRDADVVFLHNDISYPSNGDLTLPTEQLQNFAIRFRGKGYGALEGDVSCGRNGTLTYVGL